MADARAVVEEFLAALETSSLDACLKVFDERMAENIVWENSGFPTQNGREAAKAFMTFFSTQIPLVGLRVENIAIAADGNKVATERIDHFLDAEGNILASLPLAGTLEVDGDGRISAWRDYFDPRPLLGG